jgi:hypothetical protein
MIPSTTIGSATIPTALSTSRNQAKPSLPIFRSVTSFSGLKCCPSNVRPFSNHSFPAESARTLASLTSPALLGLSAKLWRRLTIAHQLIAGNLFAEFFGNLPARSCKI